MIRTDFYAVLGIAPTASAEEIRQAFRQLARQYHPDANPENPRAVEHFKVVNEAYRILSTPQLRAAYDHALQIVRPSAGPEGQGTVNKQSQPHDPIARGAERAAPTPPGTAAPVRQTSAPVRQNAPTIPSLMIRVTPGQMSLPLLHEATRFYLLTELGATGEWAVIDPMPLDLAQVIDRSSSMRGEKIFETKRAVLRLLDQLHTDDLLTLVFFDDRAEVLADGETIEGRAGIENALDLLTVRGSTEIATGLHAALERLAVRQNRSRVATLLLLTDGQTYGDEERCLELAANAREMGVSITALGLGVDWNRDLLDRLAAISGGSSHFVERASDLQSIFDEVVLRLRATLAAGMRLSLEPARGVRVARATRVAPDIAEAYSATTNPISSPSTDSPEPLTVDLGALVGRPDNESAAVLWELLLDPATLIAHAGNVTLGRLVATYWAPRQSGGQMERLDHSVSLPVQTVGAPAPIETDVRLALELITAYRLQTQADALNQQGHSAEAAHRMNTAALRLRSAGSHELADEALRAARSLGESGDRGVTETLRVKYGTKNLGIFHRLRRHAHVH